MRRKIRAFSVAGILGAALGMLGGFIGLIVEAGLGALSFRDIPEFLYTFGLMGAFSGVAYALSLMAVGMASGRIRLNILGGAGLGAVSIALGAALWVALFDSLSSTQWLEAFARILPVGALAGALIGGAFRHTDQPILKQEADAHRAARQGSRSNSA